MRPGGNDDGGALLGDADEAGLGSGLQEGGELLEGDLAGELAVKVLLGHGAVRGNDLDKIGEGSGFGVQSDLAENLGHVLFKCVDESGCHFEGIPVDDEFIGAGCGKDHGKLVDVGLFPGEVAAELFGG